MGGCTSKSPRGYSRSFGTDIPKICPTCKHEYTIRSPYAWCQPCEAKQFRENFQNWRTGNPELDEIIRESQLKNTAPNQFMEWIPWDKLEDIQEISRGGFGLMYEATWDAGPKLYWDETRKYWTREGECKVALKKMFGSQNASREFWDELSNHRSTHSDCIAHWYGFTQDPITQDYAIVTQLADGDLRHYLLENIEILSWEKKLGIVYNISHGLMELHNAGIVHRDLHSGNILRHYNGSQSLTYITDIGQCRPVNSRPSEVYGVLPYVAPEVLRGAPHTTASDVYSFGVIMWEIANNQRPFNDRPHDAKLAWEICDGLRPEIGLGVIPKCFADLIEQCWRSDPSARPDVRSLEKTIMSWGWHMGLSQKQVVADQFEKARQESLKSPTSEGFCQGHPSAIYYSRKLCFGDLPEPRDRNLYGLEMMQFRMEKEKEFGEEHGTWKQELKRSNGSKKRRGKFEVEGEEEVKIPHKDTEEDEGYDEAITINYELTDQDLSFPVTPVTVSKEMASNSYISDTERDEY